MSEPLCRVSIYGGPESRSATADLVLPTGMAVAELLPALLDVLGVSDSVDAGPGWQLARAGGPVLSSSMTLGQQGIRDGDLLLLSAAEVAPPAVVFDDDCAAVIATGEQNGEPPRVLGAAICFWAAAVGSALLLRSEAGGSLLVPAAVLLVGLAVCAVGTARARPDPVAVTTLNCATIMLAAVVAVLAVPGGPSAPDVLLAASAAAATAVLLLRVTGCGDVILTAVATVGGLTALTVCPATIRPLPIQAVGALLTVAALIALGAAPRLAAMAAGLTPELPPPEEIEETDPSDCAGLADRARHAHRILTGLTSGAAAGAVAGVVAVLADCLRTHSRPVPAAFFTTVVAAALLLRVRVHPDRRRQSALIASGTACVTASFTLVAVAYPTTTPYLALTAVALGCAVIRGHTYSAVSPVLLRAVDLLEYALLAAVLPTAAWVAGLYGMVRGIHLP